MSSLSYFICKNLKEAGYPQPYGKSIEDQRYFYLSRFEGEKIILFAFYNLENAKYDDGSVIDYAKDLVYRPTLSELIKACGDKFSALSRYDSPGITEEIHTTFQACYERNAYGHGDTPEEAVARLWLDLNKK